MQHSAEFKAFDVMVKKLLSVPKSVILEREAEYKRQSELNPRKRGPKRKVKPPASPGPAA